MSHHARAFVAALSILTLSLMVNAQTSPSKDDPQKIKKPSGKGSPSAAREGADPLANERRAMTVSLITSLADEARSFRDETLRARVQARAADVLWEVEKDRARALFRRAWEAAEIADKESARQAEEQRRALTSTARAVTRINTPNLRGEVLRLAARRDPALGEEFLAKLAEATEKEASPVVFSEDVAPNQTPPRPDNPPPAIAQRLRLARQLLEEGDVERALQFVDKALDRVTTGGIFFLSALREKNATAADQRYGAMLARAGADPSADAVTVSVLSSYAFTPFLYIIVTREGHANSSQERERITAPDLPVAVRTAFLRTAAQILLRPLPSPDQDRTLAGRVGTYFVIARLLPLFQQYAPELVAELGAQMAALTPDAQERFSNDRGNLLTRGLVPAEALRDGEREALERVDRAPNAEARDDLYVSAAMAAAWKGEARARDLADKIEETDLRKRVRAFIDFVLVNRAIERKDALEVLKLARTGDLSNIHRAWALTETARLLKKTDAARAAEVLDLALAEARRIGGSEPDRVRALVAVATQTYDLDQQRVWDAMNEAVKAANAVPEFTGQDGQIVARLQTRAGTSMTNFTVESFNLTQVFGLLARDDLYRAMDLAKSLTGEAPRAAATLAIVRTVFDQKSTVTNERNTVIRN